MVPLRNLFFLCLCVAQIGCATYQSQVSEARNLMANSTPSAAVEKLKTLAEVEGKDQLVYVLDYATALQAAGDYKRSSQIFIKADQLADLKDFTSVTQEASALLFAEELVQYKGEDFEKLLINSMNAINFVLAGDQESALVETRRSIEKLNYFRGEKKQEYDDNSFVHYLNGHMWEASRNYDSAYIDFKKAYDMGIQHPLIQQDLLRVASKGRKNTELEKLKREFAIEPDLTWKKKGMGELIVLYQQGWGPRKASNPEAPRFPILVREYSNTQKARIEVNGSVKDETYVIYDLAGAAIKTLNSQYGALVAKRIAGMVAKDVVANRVSKDNEALGAILFVAMHASDRADLRQWSTLPNTIQMARLDLPAGEHEIRIVGISREGSASGEESQVMKVTVKPGRKTFVGWRSYK